jgi:hypothetical protein
MCAGKEVEKTSLRNVTEVLKAAKRCLDPDISSTTWRCVGRSDVN